MTDYEKLSAAIKRIAGTQSNNLVLFEAEIKSVDKENKTCTVTRYDTDFPDVRLSASFTGQSDFFVTPKIGSMVIVADMSAPLLRDLAVVVFSEIDEFVFQGGANGGLVKVQALTAKLNALENDLNTLKTALKAPGVNTYGGVLASTFADWASQPITQTEASDLENPKIKH